MLYILAFFLPWLAVMLKGRIITGVVLLLLQLSLFGWIPAIIAALFIIHNENTKEALKEAVANRP